MERNKKELSEGLNKTVLLSSQLQNCVNSQYDHRKTSTSLPGTRSTALRKTQGLLHCYSTEERVSCFVGNIFSDECSSSSFQQPPPDDKSSITRKSLPTSLYGVYLALGHNSSAVICGVQACGCDVLLLFNNNTDGMRMGKRYALCLTAPPRR